MLKKNTSITDENFCEAVNVACAWNRRLRCKFYTRKIILPFGSIVFTLCATILFLGVLYTAVYNDPQRSIAFDVLPFIQKSWDAVWGMMGNLTELLHVKIMLMILLLVLAPFVFCSIANFLLSCVINVKKPVIQGNTAQQAKQLYVYLKNTAETYSGTHYETSGLWRRICGIVSGLCIIVFVLYQEGSAINQNSNFAAALSVLFQSEEHTETILICGSFGVIFYAMYAVLHTVFILLIRPYCDSRSKGEKLLDEAERYWVSVDDGERKRREEEATHEPYDGWKYSSIGKSLYYKEKAKEYYAQYTGQPYESDEDQAKRLVRDVEDDLSGGGWGNY